MKICLQCKLNLEEKEFSKASRTKDGLRWTCKKCCKNKMDQYRSNPDVVKRERARNNQYNKNNPDVIKRAKKKWENNNPEGFKRYNLLCKYGLTLEKYNEILASQNECCAICKEHQSKQKKSLYVDHCHVSGKIRGLLCYQCNIVLGHFRDSPIILQFCMDYLKHHGTK